jgi:hypothetical protein
VRNSYSDLYPRKLCGAESTDLEDKVEPIRHIGLVIGARREFDHFLSHYVGVCGPIPSVPRFALRASGYASPELSTPTSRSNKFDQNELPRGGGKPFCETQSVTDCVCTF